MCGVNTCVVQNNWSSQTHEEFPDEGWSLAKGLERCFIGGRERREKKLY